MIIQHKSLFNIIYIKIMNLINAHEELHRYIMP